MLRRALTVFGLAFVVVMANCALDEGAMRGSEPAPLPVIDFSSIELKKALHFTAADGSDLVVPSGIYHVDEGQGDQLQLSPQDGAKPLLMAAMAVEHDVEVLSPVALTVPFDADQHHVLLLQPGGRALDAAGSLSGVRGRGPLTALGAGKIATGVQTSVLWRPSLASALGPGTRLRVFDYQLTPAPSATSFTGCVKPAGWVSAAVAESYVAPAGSATPMGPGTATGYNPFPPGSPWGRGAFPGYHCAFGSVTITPPPSSKPPTGQHRLLVTSYVYTAGGTLLSMTVTDVYHVTPGNWTLSQVILATGRTATTPVNYDYRRVVTQYYASLPNGSPVKFELQVDGVSVAEKHCTFKASMTQAPTLKCP